MGDEKLVVAMPDRGRSGGEGDDDAGDSYGFTITMHDRHDGRVPDDDDGGTPSHGVAQLVERRTRDAKDPRFEPRLRQEEHERIYESLFRVKNVVLARCRCVHATPVCIRMHQNDHARTLQLLVVHVRVRLIMETRKDEACPL